MSLLARMGLGDRRPRFSPPLPCARVTVTLEPVFRRTGNLHYIDPSDPAAVGKLRMLSPAALAGPVQALLDLARRFRTGWPTHAVVVLTREGQPCVSEPDRDALWAAYRVPAFEQVITDTGRLIAW